MEVQLYVYDISQGLTKQFGPTLLGIPIEGIWHTGVVVYGQEYFYGGGISYDFPVQPFFLVVIYQPLG